MNELIKREDAINAVAELQAIAQSKAELTGISKAWKRIKALPTVDAVKVVRCMKCYYKDEKRIMDEDALWCRRHHMYVTADWFCADGDRKDSSV